VTPTYAWMLVPHGMWKSLLKPSSFFAQAVAILGLSRGTCFWQAGMLGLIWFVSPFLSRREHPAVRGRHNMCRACTCGNHQSPCCRCIAGDVLSVGWCCKASALPTRLCRRLRTRFIEATHNPVWDERHEVYLADEADTIKVWVKVGQQGL
jgi:hypothetical protein